MASKTISVNRAPVLTLWAAVVARRLGFTTAGKKSWGAEGDLDLGLIERLATERA
jgi:hypothetical protein